MSVYRSHADPPISLADRVRQLNENLATLAVRLKDAIAEIISKAVAQAVHDGVNGLLGNSDLTHRHSGPGLNRSQQDNWQAGPERDPWAGDEDEDEGRQWNYGQPAPARTDRRSRWTEAARAAAQTALWWLRQQPKKRPLLTTTLVALAGGCAALVAGPTLVGCLTVAVSVVSLLLTTDSTRSAAEMLGVG
jgi:hypothetical protein